MNRTPSRRAVFLTALLSCLLLPAVFLAQSTGPKALVVCPPTDSAGCNRIAEQLRLTKTSAGASVFPGGVHTRYAELRTMTVPELQSYAVVFVPSLANAPYDLLREDGVKLRLLQVLRGRVAVWSGTPDRGSATGKSSGKLTLIQNLARWAAGQYGDGSTGLVVLQDFSDPKPDGTSPRYDWIQGIAGARLSPDVAVRTYGSVEKNSANPAAAAIVGSLAYDNMASFGLTALSGPGIVGAWGVSGTGKTASRGQAVLVTFTRRPAASFTVGPQGGTITSGRVTLSIPEGALSQTTSITIEPVGPLADSGSVSNTAYSFGPDGLVFAKPATLTITYDQADVPSYVVEDSLHVFRQAETSTVWEEVAGSTVDPTANRVVAAIGGFSKYTAKARPPGVPPGPPDPVPPNKGAAAVNVTPDTASVLPGQTRTLTAKATDKKGNPLLGRVVNWTHTGAALGFTLSATADTTDSNGEATTIVTAPNTAGAKDTVTATVDGKTDKSVITVIAGPAHTIAAFSGDGATRAVGSVDSIRARVTDQFGNPIPGYTVQWAAGAGSGSVSPSSSTTGANGVAATAWTLGGTAGPQTATATATGLNGSPVTFTATATAGGAARLAITTQPPDSAQSGIAFTTAPVVQLQDQFGNPVSQSGISITARIASGGGTVKGDSVESTGAGGAATFDNLAICGTLGPRTVEFVSTGLAPDTSETVELTAGPADSMAISAGDGQTGSAGTPVAIDPAVLVLDGCGNPVSGVPVTFTPSADGQVTGSPASTDASGIATVGSWTLRTTAGVDSLTASATGINSVVFTASLGASDADTIFIFSGNNATREVASADSIRVKVTDSHGNPVQGHTVEWAAGAGSGSVSPGSSTTGADGVAAAEWTLGTTAGPQTATATATGLGGSPVTFDATATAGSPAAVTVAPAGDTISAGGTANFTATVTDQYGNVIAAPTVNWTSSNEAAATVSPPTGTSTTATGASPLAADDSTHIIATSGSAADSASLLVLAVSAPNAQPDSFTVATNTTLNGDLTADNGSGADDLGTPPGAVASFGGGSLGGTVESNAAGASVALAGGTLTVNANGTFSLANPTTAGTFTFLYRLTNPSGSDDALVTIHVQQGPDAKDDAFAVLPNTTLNGDLTADNGSGADVLGTPAATVASFGGGSLGGTVESNAAGSSVSLAGGTLTVNADGTFSLVNPTATGTHTFLYRLTNSVGSDDATVTITVQRPPDAKDDAFTTTLPTSVNGNLTADNGSGADDLGDPAGAVASFGGGSLSGGAGNHAAGASVSLAGGTLTVNANGTFSLTSPTTGGTFTFRYLLTNPAGSDSATVTITVNQPPVANDDAAAGTSAPGDAFHTPFETALVAPGGNTPSLLANDVVGFPAATIVSFGGGSLSGDATTNPAGTTVVDTEGSLTVNGNGSFTFTPATGFTGLFTFNYRLSNTPGFDDALVTIAVGVRPVAVNDTYGPTLIGNVPINTARVGGTGFTVLTNDQGDARIASLVSATNGIATVNNDGTITFAPTPGFEGAATITYKVSNGFGDSPANATVALTVGEPIWFVNAAVANGNGTLPSPFNCLTGAGCLSAAAHDANDRIFLYTGGYTGGITLQNGERLIGQGATASLSSVAGLTWPADSETEPATNGTAPTITGSAITAVTLNNTGAAGTNLLRGFNFGNVGATGTALGGTGFGTLTISEVGITTDGRALNLSTGTISGSFPGVTSTGGANNVSLTAIVGGTSGSPISLGAGTFSGGTGAAIAINGGSVFLTYSGNVTHTAGAPLLHVSNGHTGGLTFGTGTLGASVSSQGLLFENADGAYSFTGTTTLGGAARLLINAGADATNGSQGTFTFGTGTSISNPTATAFQVEASKANVTYDGTISQTNAQRGVYLLNNKGGTVTLNGALTLSTAGQPGFEASSASPGTSTVAVTATSNTISSGAGVALRVNGVTIGASGLRFRSISSSGASNGIVLNNTGTSGGLTVTGTGAAGTGGTIQSSTGDGISLNTTRNISISSLNLQNNLGSGVSGSNVTAFGLTGSTVSGNGNAAGEAGLEFDGLFGASTILNTTVTGSAEDNLVVRNTSGTLDSLVVVGSTFSNNSAAVGSDGILVTTSNSAIATVRVRNNTFSAHRGDHFQATASNAANLNVVLSGNTLSGGHASPLGQGITIGTGTSFTGTLTYDLASNQIPNGPISNAITLRQAGDAGSLMQGKVRNNIIGTTGVGLSCSTQASGIVLEVAVRGTHTASVTGNTVRRCFDRGIFVDGADGDSAVINVTVTGNTVAELVGVNAREGLHVDLGAFDPNVLGVSDRFISCMAIGGALAADKNTLSHGGGAPDDIRLRLRFRSRMHLPGYAGSFNNAASEVNAYLAARNTITASSATASVANSSYGYHTTASCPTPP